MGRSLTGCEFNSLGTALALHTTKYFDPYVLVLVNGHLSKVDQAVAILKGEVRRHQKGCACS
jgi:hypothetical protein